MTKYFPAATLTQWIPRTKAMIAMLLAGIFFSGALSSPAFAQGTDDKEPELTGFKKIEKSIDDVAGKVNSAISSVFFYPLFKSSRTENVDLPANADAESVREALRTKLEAESFGMGENNLTIRLPKDTLSKEAGETIAKELQELLDRKVTFSDGATKGAQMEVDIVRPGILLAVVWLVFGAVFFTIRMGFINLRGFGHAIAVTRGKFDAPGHEGEVSHFQALCAALSATVGLGNIAGVAIAVSAGGPGATFWMIAAGLLGMSAKFVECSLGQMYRKVRPDGRVMGGGAMYYLSDGLAERGLAPLGKILAVLFAVLCILGSFAGGNAFQVKQSLGAVSRVVPFLQDNGWVYGIIMTLLVGIVIIGGIKRIATTAEKIVPVMCGVYVLACLFILFNNASAVPAAFASIVSQAFSPQAAFGGFLGVLVVGFQRAAFSNEAGVGSAAIAHSAAKTPYAVREGIVALLEPFIDTVVVCTMTALVIVITGAYNSTDPVIVELIAKQEGAALTSEAMKSQINGFQYVLGLATVLFAFSTMISWSYYGERCWAWLFGDNASMIYRVIFLFFVMLGSIVSATNVLAFGDLMILGMAFPNILGVLFLSGKVKTALNEYWAKYKSGELAEEAKGN